MLARLAVVVLLAGFCGNAEARSIYTIAGGGALPPPKVGEPAVPATAISLEFAGVTALPGGRFLIPHFGHASLVLDEQGMVHAVPRPRNLIPQEGRMLGTDRFGTEYFYFSEAPPGLVLRRPGGTYEPFAPLSSATDMLVHPDGGVLVAVGIEVVRFMPDGTQIRVAGGPRGDSGDGGPANRARLRYPTHLVWAADGALLIADRNDNRVRRVDPLDATISTVAGTGERGFGGDGGPATKAPLDWPAELVKGRHGGLGIVEGGFPRPRIRRVSSTGIIRTVAGGGPPRSFGRGTSILNGDGEHAHNGALSEPSSVHITPQDEYVFADGDLVRFVTSPRTTRLALALRTVLPARRRVSYSLTVPARLRLVVHGEGRRVVRVTRGRAGLGYFRLPPGLPPGGYALTLTATAADQAVAVREAAMITTPRLSRRAASAALHAQEDERPLISHHGLDTTVQRSLAGRTTRCHRFSRRRIDCMIEDKRTQDCLIGSTHLDPRGQLYIGHYNCTARGFERQPVRAPHRWHLEPMLMLGPGPYDS